MAAAVDGKPRPLRPPPAAAAACCTAQGCCAEGEGGRSLQVEEAEEIPERLPEEEEAGAGVLRGVKAAEGAWEDVSRPVGGAGDRAGDQSEAAGAAPRVSSAAAGGQSGAPASQG